MSEFTSEQLSVSTVEDEKNYFSGEIQSIGKPSINCPMPSGIYRVVDGTLYQILATDPRPASSETDRCIETA